MTAPHSCTICFCGIRIRFDFPGPVTLPRELSAFLCDDSAPIDARYTVVLRRQPLPLPGKPIHIQAGTELYRTDKGWLRVYTPLTTEEGLQVACLLCPDGSHQLYYPAHMWDHYANPIRLVHLIGIETLLLEHSAFLLHSSVVRYQGKAVLFAGPACAGKSTQAALWQQHLGAEILNGDRCVIRRYPEGFRGGGSPWAGTSGIYHREDAPIAAVFLVRQAPENSVQRLAGEAFGPLFSQTLVNSWDREFMELLTELYQDFLSCVPIYLLRCRPDEGAVRAALQVLPGTTRIPPDGGSI